MADKEKFRKYKGGDGSVTLTKKGSDYDTGDGITDMANAYVLQTGTKIAKNIDKEEAASGKKGRKSYESYASPRNIAWSKKRAKEDREENAKKKGDSKFFPVTTKGK